MTKTSIVEKSVVRKTVEIPVIPSPEFLSDDDQIVEHLRCMRRRADSDAIRENLIKTDVLLVAVDASLSSP
jgi:hypothetical protein